MSSKIEIYLTKEKIYLHKYMRVQPLVYSLFTLIFLLSRCPEIQAQNQTDNYGKEFRFTLLENYGNLDKASFVLSLTKLPDTVRIRVGAQTFPFVVHRNLDTIISFTKTTVPAVSQFGPNKGLLLTTAHPAALFVMNNVQNSSDISNITPSEKIPGNPEYYINTYRGDESIGKSNNSLFSVVAIDDSVQINIMPTADSKYNLLKNQPFTILLRKGQVYYEQAEDSQSFAGTRIWNSRGCKRFAVFEGAKCSYVDYSSGNCRGCDHLYNQGRPAQYLGTSFTMLPFAGMSKGFYYQIVATDNNTGISINGVPGLVLNRAQVYTVNQNSNVPVCLKSDKPISVVQMMKSGECNGHSTNLGNPSLMNVIPDNQTVVRAGFSFPSTSNISQNPSFPAEFYLALACPLGALASVRINGTLPDTTAFSTTCGMRYGIIKLNPTLRYNLLSDKGFIGYMYAYGQDESYASAIGSSFENNTTRMLVESNTTYSCDSLHQFKFRAASDSAATFTWVFGDGSTANGDSVVKQFPRTGRYKVQMKAVYTGNAGCKEDTFNKTVSVLKQPYFSLGPDTTVCNGTLFELVPLTEPKVAYRWSNGSSSRLLAVSRTQRVWLTLTDSNACSFTDTVQVVFKNCDSSGLVVPNVFTPGTEDGINDLFETRFTGYDQVEGKLFNRWGQPVYSFTFPSDAYWNGCYDNDVSRPCPAGTYYYLLEFSNNSNGSRKSVSGAVRLIR